VERVPYRLPQLLKGVAGGDWVFVVEGEKDADCLVGKGLVATCNSGGAEKFPPSHAGFFSGARVVILPDNDEKGRRHAEQVASILQRSSCEVRVVELPGLGHKEDVSDWFIKGGTVDALLHLTTEAGVRSPAGETPAAADGDTKPQDPFADSTRRPVSICMADVVPERVRWLWYPRIPLGKVTIFDGDPDVGKSTVTIDIAARVSNGCPLPDGNRSDVGGPGGVILVSAEDGPGDTIRPRLDAAGADVKRVHLLTDVDFVDDEGCPRCRPWSMPQDLDVLKILAVETGARLIVVDPFTAFLDSSFNAYRDPDIRRALAPLARLAEETGAAVALVRHLNKAVGVNALYRGGGSIGIIGAARSALLFAKDPSDPSGNRKVMAREKGNLAQVWPSLAYELVSSEEHGCARVRWLGESAQSAATLLAVPATSEEVSVIDEATAFLREILADGPLAQKQIVAEGRKIGISEKTLQRAKKDINVRSRKVGLGGWVWELPIEDGQGANDGQVGQVDHLQHDQEVRADEGGQTLEGGHFEAEAMFNPLVLHCEVCEQVIVGEDRQTGLPWHESCRPEPTSEELDAEQSEEVWT
jgi:5S rRNA maturation endonuclease (ribonuclease M5)